MIDLSRAQFLRLGLASTCFAPWRAFGQGEAADAVAAPAAAATAGERDAWMQKWMQRARPPKGGLYLFRFSDRTWVVTQKIGWTPAAKDAAKYSPVCVPRGFVTDLTSIPQLFFSLLPPDDKYTYAAIIHDYLYWNQDQKVFPREAADDIFRIVMKEFKVANWKSEAIFRAVRSPFGESAWNQNAALKANGEKRILTKLPEDPLVSWAKWKDQRDIYASQPAKCD